MSTLKPRRKLPNICARCNSTDVETHARESIVDFKGLTLEVPGLVETVCKVCHLNWQTPDQEQQNLALLRDAFAKKRDVVRQRDGLLTGDEIAEIVSLLRLTRAESADVFGGGPNAFSKYIHGDVLQSVPMDRLLRLAYYFGQPAVQFLRQSGRGRLNVLHGYVVTSNGSTSGTAVITNASHNSGNFVMSNVLGASAKT